MIYANYNNPDYLEDFNMALDSDQFDKDEYSNFSEDEIYETIQKLLACVDMEDALDFL